MTKVIWGVLFAALVAYLAAALLRGGGDVNTVTAVSYTVENACTINGVLVRREAPLVSGAEFVDVRPADGEKVATGQVLAITCESEEQLDDLRRIDELEVSIQQLGSILEQDITPSKAVELDSDIGSALIDISTLKAGGDLFGASGLIAEIKSLVVARTELSSSPEEAASAYSAMQNELSAIMSRITGSRITSNVSGTFSSRTDGYEAVLTPETLDNITVEELKALDDGDVTGQEGAFGKLVSGIQWHYAAAVDFEDVESFRAGDTVRMRFLNGCGGDLEMTVERVGEKNEQGQCILVLSCTQAMADTIALRWQTAEIINSSVVGIRVPKSAMRVNEEGQSGVYCVNGATATFRKAQVIWDLEDYVLVAVQPDSTEHLRAGEKIILGEKDLYEGKVVVSD